MSRIIASRPSARHRPLFRFPGPSALLSLLLVSIILTSTAGSIAAAPGAASETRPASAIDPPAVSARAIFSYDLTSGVVLYEKNPTERMQVGSTVKIMTALVVMKLGKLDDEVLILESDEVDVEMYSNMQLVAGDTLTVGTLLYGLLLPSGNDGANALARHIGGQISGSDDPNTAINAFVEAMNDMAAELGLRNSNFTNPSGIDSKNSYSSAQDIAILFGRLMKDPKLADIVAQPAYSFLSAGPRPRQYQGQTTNELLNKSGVIGGKTGTTDDAGGCVVFARQVNGGANTVITAVLGSEVTYDSTGMKAEDVRWDDAQNILNEMDARFSWVVPGADDTFPGLAEEMAIWQVEFRDPPAIPVPSGGDSWTTYQLVLGPPVEAGERCGTLRLLVSGRTVGSIPIYQTGAAASLPPVLAWAA